MLKFLDTCLISHTTKKLETKRYKKATCLEIYRNYNSKRSTTHKFNGSIGLINLVISISSPEYRSQTCRKYF